MTDADHKLASSRESFGGKGAIGVRIYVSIGREPTENDYRALAKARDEIADALLVETYRTDPADIAAYATERAELIALFPSPIYVEEIPDGYGATLPYRVNRRWLRVTTPIGHFVIGCRKRVINIDWTGTVVTKHGAELFPDEGVTVSHPYDKSRYVHAWSLDKAREYIAVILAAEGVPA